MTLLLTFTDAERATIYAAAVDGGLDAALDQAGRIRAALPEARYCQIEPAADDPELLAQVLAGRLI